MSVFDDLKDLIDKNNDGKIDKADLDAYIGDGSEATQDIVAALKEKADTNDDGTIDGADLASLKNLFSDTN